jgi:hypothetical protein
MKFRPVALGIALGMLWGGAIFVTTWLSYFTGYGNLFLNALPGSVYPGYAISPMGSFIGFGYGFADLFIGGFLLAWIYNKIAKT